MPHFRHGRPGWNDPFHAWRVLQEMNRALQGQPGAEPPGGTAAPGEFPPVNVHAGDDAVVLTAEVPGIAPEAIDITVEHNAITLKGERPTDPVESDEKAAVHRRERSAGRFARTVELPFPIDTEKVQASFENGVLAIKLPRPEAAKPRRIKIQKG